MEMKSLREDHGRVKFLLEEIVKGLDMIETDKDSVDYIDFLKKKRKDKEDETAENTKELNEKF